MKMSYLILRSLLQNNNTIYRFRHLLKESDTIKHDSYYSPQEFNIVHYNPPKREKFSIQF